MHLIKANILLAFVSLSISLGAQTVCYLENDIRFMEGQNIVSLSHYGERNTSQKFGFSDYVSVSNGWAEFLGGPYIRPTKNSLVALYVGYETTDNIRFGGYAYCYLNDGVFVSAFYEKGMKNSFDYYDVMCKVGLRKTDNVDLLIAGRVRQGYGVGVPVIIKIKNVFSEDFNIDIFLTAFYNATEYSDPRWVPTISANLEF